MLVRLVLAGWLMFCVLCVSAGEADRSAAHVDEFQGFFAPLLDGEWVYHTRMTGPDGKVTFDGEDKRQYRLGVRGRFMIEDVYRADGEHVGIQLYGLNVQTGDVHVAQYWSWQPTRLGDITARIDADARRLTGAGTPAGQAWPKMAIECAFEGLGRYRCVTQAHGPDGQRWRANVETLTRAP